MSCFQKTFGTSTIILCSLIDILKTDANTTADLRNIIKKSVFYFFENCLGLRCAAPKDNFSGSLQAGQAPAGDGLCWCSGWCWSGPTNPPLTNPQLEGKDKRVFSAWLDEPAAPRTVPRQAPCAGFVSQPHFISGGEIKSIPSEANAGL